ncbi:16411_t:CDS:2, partial [Cetraspora pellucida]
MSSFNNTHTSRAAVASGSLYRTSSGRIPDNQQELYSSSDEYPSSLESTITSDYINQAARDLKWYKRMFWILLLSLIIVICLYFSSQNKILNLEEEKNDLYNKYVDMINEII